MMKKHTLIAILFGLCLSACSSSDNEPTPVVVTQGKATLTTRVSADQSTDFDNAIPYPISLCAFTEDGTFAATSTAHDESETTTLALDAGTYLVTAVAGCPIHETDDITPSTPIVTKATVGSDVQTGSCTATLQMGEVGNCHIALQRQVLMLNGITMTKVPDNIAMVHISIGNLYTTLALDGTKSGCGSSILQLKNEGDGVWSNNTRTYLLPSNGKAVLNIDMADADGNNNFYSMTVDEGFEANYMYSLAMEYTPTHQGEDVRVQVTVDGDQWQGKKDLSLTFSEDDKTEAPTAADAPVVGTLYKGAYVLRSESVAGTTTVTLMTTTPAKHDNKGTAFVFNEKSYSLSDASRQADWEACMKKLLPDMTAELVKEGISDWRVANMEDACYLTDHNDDVRASLKALGCSVIDFGVSYMPICEQGVYYKFSFEDKKAVTITTAKPGHVLYLRAFTTLTFTN